jgi:hypothetical protein
VQCRVHPFAREAKAPGVEVCGADVDRSEARAPVAAQQPRDLEPAEWALAVVEQGEVGHVEVFAEVLWVDAAFTAAWNPWQR